MGKWECWIGGRDEEDDAPDECREPDMVVEASEAEWAAEAAVSEYESDQVDYSLDGSSRLVSVRRVTSCDCGKVGRGALVVFEAAAEQRIAYDMTEVVPATPTTEGPKSDCESTFVMGSVSRFDTNTADGRESGE